ncbi:MAG: DUF819 family protein [Trichlorobacter sp.]|uniref:DUF819 family protein n=1 Tax=Trichlorobacter sp. TaxID=2911007 RepID=UPI0025651E08|nr:DUF819 family protein [Trichlorobacter sp.]MDK9717633.1 DUF819 family protein [Trichlorobacter sp.]
MIQQPLLIILFLLGIELLILRLAHHEQTRHWFNLLPPVFWIYFLPMLASSFGLLDPKQPVYGLITSWLLPASLLLLLLPVDLKAIIRLGPTALAVFFSGTAGIIVGAALVFKLFKPLIGEQFWSGFGALSASWTGGSANMIAAKEAVSVPDQVFAPMVIVDTVVPYLWMAALIAGVALQPAFDRWNRADRRIIDELGSRIVEAGQAVQQRFNMGGFLVLLPLAAAGSSISHWLGSQLPTIKDVISGYTWTILLVSLLGLLLSCSPARKLEQYGASKVGSWLLYFVLTAIGAKASVASFGSALLLIGAGLLIMAVHALFLLVAARLLKAPLFLVAAASQANVGGVASAPVVAEVYQPGLASVGLLLAILGNIFGTWFGILCAQLCRLL